MMDEQQALGRTERRYLRRVFNGRTVPLKVGDHAFLTFKEASRHLMGLDDEARDVAYREMRSQAEAEAKATSEVS